MLDEKDFPGSVADGTKPAASGRVAATGDTYPTLRQLAGRAYQLRATARGADVFIARESAEDRDSGAWLISSAVDLAADIAAELDGLSRHLRDRPPESHLVHPLQQVRIRAHQLHAATRAADHFLEQENNEDRSTGSWLIASALGLADKLVDELEDLANSLKKPAVTEGAVTPTPFADIAAPRRSGPLPHLRGAA
jgi:hypothetical protein